MMHDGWMFPGQEQGHQFPRERRQCTVPYPRTWYGIPHKSACNVQFNPRDVGVILGIFSSSPTPFCCWRCAAASTLTLRTNLGHVPERLDLFCSKGVRHLRLHTRASINSTLFLFFSFFELRVFRRVGGRQRAGLLRTWLLETGIAGSRKGKLTIRHDTDTTNARSSGTQVPDE